MIVDLPGAVADVVGKLQAAGIRAAADPRDLNPPAVYVAPPELSFRFGRNVDASWTLAAVVPNVGRKQSLDQLGPLISQVLDVFPAITGGRPTDLVGGLDAGGPQPAYELTMTTRIQ